MNVSGRKKRGEGGESFPSVSFSLLNVGIAPPTSLQERLWALVVLRKLAYGQDAQGLRGTLVAVNMPSSHFPILYNPIENWKVTDYPASFSLIKKFV